MHVTRRVQHQRLIDRLAALRTSGAAWQHGEPFLPRNPDCRLHIGGVARQSHSDGLDLVDGSVGGVTPAGEGVEQDFTAECLAQTRRQGRIANSVAHEFTYE